MKRLISVVLIICLTGSSLAIPMPSMASVSGLPLPGAMVNTSPAYVPILIKGLKIHPDNPLLFDFIIDSGHSKLDRQSKEFKDEAEKLIKYFLAALTFKDEELWVNLSPYEKDRIIPDALAKTELGRDMLAQDYILKQLTASLVYPEKQLGKTFWDKIYAKAKEKFGTTDVPVDSFNKVWIVADKAKVLERSNAGYVVRAHLKVLMDEDYVALSNQKERAKFLVPTRNLALAKGSPASQNPSVPAGSQGTGALGAKNNGTVNKIGSQIVREIIIPEIEKEVNEGKNFAPIRQIYYSMILAAWYKQAIKDALLNRVYSNKTKTGGILSDDPKVKEKIYQQYLEAFQKGVFNYIKEDVDAVSQQIIPRKYFSGGMLIPPAKLIERTTIPTRDDNTQASGEMSQVQAKIDIKLEQGQNIIPASGAAPREDVAANDPSKVPDVVARLRKSLNYVNQELAAPTMQLLLIAEKAFESDADVNQVREEFNKRREQMRSDLSSERLQKYLDILLPDFDHALVVWLLPVYDYNYVFFSRVNKMVRTSPRAAMLFLGLLGIHSRNGLDDDDLIIYPGLIKAAVKYMQDSKTEEEKANVGRAIINGLVVYAYGRYKYFLSALEEVEPKLKGTLETAFSMNKDLLLRKDLHPIFSWESEDGLLDWVNKAFMQDRKLEDISLAGKVPHNDEMGFLKSEQIRENLAILQEFSGYGSLEKSQATTKNHSVSALTSPLLESGAAISLGQYVSDWLGFDPAIPAFVMVVGFGMWWNKIFRNNPKGDLYDALHSRNHEDRFRALGSLQNQKMDTATAGVLTDYFKEVFPKVFNPQLNGYEQEITEYKLELDQIVRIFTMNYRSQTSMFSAGGGEKSYGRIPTYEEKKQLDAIRSLFVEAKAPLLGREDMMWSFTDTYKNFERLYSVVERQWYSKERRLAYVQELIEDFYNLRNSLRNDSDAWLRTPLKIHRILQKLRSHLYEDVDDLTNHFQKLSVIKLYLVRDRNKYLQSLLTEVNGIRAGLVEIQGAMRTDKQKASAVAGTATQKSGEPKYSAPGGIDLNFKNLDLDIDKDGPGVEMEFDPAVVAEFERGNFTGVIPIILRITPLVSPLSIVGPEGDPQQADATAR
ncbi:MAG: hypothetical protein JNN05_03035 [Candidatus Omnitrophica bacterium]|nr:hypothetical protein [Candidatus Omnitrophota bacterium]